MDEAIAELLKEIAPNAKEGLRGVIIVGKVTSQQRYAAREGRPGEVVCTAVVGEGVSWNLKFSEGSTVPGSGFQGAFLINANDMYKGKNGVNTPCLGFA